MSEIITIPILYDPVLQNLSRFSVELDLDYLYLFTDNLNRSSGHNYIDEYNEYCIIWAKGRQIYYPNSSQAVIEGIKYVDNVFGIGTYSKMNVSAPKCFEYLHLKLKEINIEQLR